MNRPKHGLVHHTLAMSLILGGAALFTSSAFAYQQAHILDPLV